MIRTLRSYYAAFQASSRLGRACRLRDKGQTHEAIAVAREGLTILGRPFVKRFNPVEGSALVSLTTLMEELTSKLHQPGAPLRDLKDSLRVLKATSGKIFH